MPTPPVSKAFATRLIAAVNKALSEGHRPPQTPGYGPGALAVAATAVGKSSSYITPVLIRRIKMLHGVEPDWSLWKEPQPTEPPALSLPTQTTLADRVLPLLKRGAFTEETLAAQLKTTRGRVIDALDELKARGVALVETHGAWTANASAEPAFVGGASHEYLSTKDNRYRFGVVADSHLGSKYERLDALNDIYDRFAKEGIERVYHAGNWIEGEAHFNRTEIHVHGMDAQLRYLAAKYPQRPGITTYAVTGNDHEGWYAKREGIDIGDRAESIMRNAGRTDWVNMGYMEAHITLRNANTGKIAVAALVHPGGGCFDGNAEILTRGRGWIAFADLTMFDDAATMRKHDHVFEWQKPTHITNEAYSGRMIRLRNRVFDCSVTPNHRFMVRRYATARRAAIGSLHPEKARWRHSPDWQIVTADEIASDYSRQQWSFPTACQGWEGVYTATIAVPHRAPKKYASSPIFHVGALPIEDAAELVGWFASEGSVDAKLKTTVLSQERGVNPDKHAQIAALVARCEFPHAITERCVRITSVEVTEWLATECGIGAANKRLPGWLKEQPAPVLRIALDALLQGDGWKAGRDGTSFGYKTISRRLADDISEIAQKCGFGVTFRHAGREITVNLRLIQNTPTLNEPPESFHYDGRIYCCTVPNGMIYVRSNGKAFWSHNSAYADSYVVQKILESLDGGEKPAFAMYGHYHKALAGEYRNVFWVLVPSTKDQDTFMRGKRIRSVIGGCIVDLEQDPASGGIIGMTPTIWRYFNKGFYDGRWSHSGDVTLPERGRGGP